MKTGEQMSLVTRTALAVALMSMTIMAAAGTTAFVVLRQNTIEILETSAANEIRAAAAHIENRLQAMNERVRALAGNIVVGNALVDASGRDVYLAPLLRSVTEVQGTAIGLVLTDFEGKRLLAVGVPWTEHPGDRDWLTRVINSALPEAHETVFDETNTRIAIAYPVVSTLTNGVEGVMIAHVSAQTIIGTRAGAAERPYRLVQRAPDRALHDGVASTVLDVAAVLRPLQLTLTAPVDRRGLETALKELTTRFAAIGFAVMALIVVVSVAVARRVTEPLRQMADAAARIVSTDSLPESFAISGSGEIGALARAFDGMMARVKGAADSERQNRETRLEFLQQRLIDAIESVSDGIALFDAREHLVEFNKSYARLMTPAGAVFQHGVKFEGLLQAIAAGGFYPGAGPDWVARRLRQFRALEDVEYRAKTPRGERWMVSRHFRTGDGSTFLIINDITEQKEAAEALLAAKLKAEAANKAKTEFVATVSHELRTPLTSIRGSLALIDGGIAGVLPDRARDLVDMAKRNTERLINIVNDVLDVQKIEAGGMEFKLEALDLSQLLRTAIEANRAYAEGLGVTLTLADAPPGPCPAVGDAGRLLQVMGNLISNASKFSPSGAAVEVSLARRGHKWRIAVADRGRGIPPGFRRRIFEKFVQVDSSDTRAVGGTGLGLSIVKAIVESHGGHIAFCVRPQGGTIFFFTLPAARQTASAAQ